MINVETFCLNCMKDMGNNDSCPDCPDELAYQQNKAALPSKTLLNKRFLIGRVLGQPGGFGITYLAWDMLLDTTAAIKEFLPLSSVSRENDNVSVRANSTRDEFVFNRGLQVFLKEAKVLAQFSHPNIVRIRDYFTANNTAYLVMEYHSGQALDKIVEEAGGSLTEQQAMEIMAPIMNGLEAVHKKGFLHRDIKPQNIYLTDKGLPILLDFGASRFAVADSTQTMTVILSAGYAPFEQYHKKGKQGAWTDVYSCGATLYYMVTGKMPVDALERQHSDQLLAPIRVNSQLSELFSQHIMRAMALEPQARPQTVSVLKENLENSGAGNHILLKKTGNFPSSKADRQTVIIQYEKNQNQFGFKHIAWSLGFVIVLWIGWGVNNSKEKPVVPNHIPEHEIEQEIDEEIGLTEEYDDAFIEPVAAFEEPFDTDVIENTPIENQPEMNSQPQAIIIEKPQKMNNIMQPANPVKVFPAPPAVIVEETISACRNKSIQESCKLDKLTRDKGGVCLPIKGYQQLACIPKNRPPRHPPPGRGLRR